MDKNEFQKTLVEVRRAYRLIYLYQRRVLDLVNFIGSKMSLNFHGGWSKFSRPAGTNSRVKLDKWAWDWLTLYFYEFHFGIVRDEIKFSIVLQSDSGFFEAESISKLDISKFVNAEDSSTRLYFVVANKKWDCPVHHFLNDHWKSKETEFKKESDDGQIWLAKAYDLTLFLDEASTISIINDFLNYTSANGILINEENNEVQQSF